MKKIDLTGQRFGHLTVLEEVPKEQRKVKQRVSWRCKCDCGKEAIVTSDKLRRGEQQSCGHKCDFYKKHFIKDLTNQRFGKLTVLRDSGKRQQRGVIWECVCDCGKKCEYLSQTLIKGRALSCGCLKESYGEYLIASILDNFNIPYEREKTFETCLFGDTKKSARFDFFVNNQYIIEYDGSQHFKADNYKWNTEEKLKSTQAHDNYKNNWCKENNIPLIRIPYTHMQKICIDDLKLETTKWRVC